MNGVNSKKQKRANCQAILKTIINGRECVALADAGATVSLIRHDVAKELRLKFTPTTLIATGVTNNALNIEYETLGIIQIASERHQQRLFIVKNISQEVILGTDFLTKLGEVTYDFANCTFRFGRFTIPMGSREDVCTVRLVNTTKIPPLSEVAVVAQLNSNSLHNKDCIFEGTNAFTSKKLLIGRSVDKMQGNMIRIPIINTGKDFHEIQVNTIIGEVEAFDEDALMTTQVHEKQKKTCKTKPGDRLSLNNTSLDDIEKSQLKNLINEYEDIVGETISELGRTSIVQHVIETVPGTAPIRSKPYNIPIGLRAEVKKQLDEMQKQGLITLSSGEWTSPIVLVKKKDNTWRFCVDYRKLNAVTVKTSMALSSISNAAEIMHGKKYFSTIDLCSGFFQVALHEGSQEKSGFITPWGPYKWKVMPQGASSSPSTFSRLSLALMADLISEGSSCVYLDDWLMTSKDFTSHLQLLRTVFERLRYAGLRYRLSKSHFCQNQVLYLGHIISQEGMSVAPHNVEKIKNFPNPKDKSGVRRLLGLFGFYRSFIKDFSNIAAPLIKLTNKDIPFVWSKECQDTADELKSRICSAPILKFPDFSRQFVLTTDASGIALGAVLSQIADDGKDHPIAFFSKALSTDEKKWDSCEQELYAILCAIKHFRHYLLNTHFRVRTDNRACTYILTTSELSPRLARWALQLSDYDFTVEHTPGKHNLVADALSRAEQVAAVETKDTKIENDMKHAQSRDYYLGPILLYLEKNKFPVDISKSNARMVKKDSENFQIVNGVLYRKNGAKLLLAIPSSQRKALLFANHESLMSLHPGVTKTMLKMKDKYWFPHMQKEVEKHVAECGSCQRRKSPKIPMRVPLKNQMAESPFQVLSMDFQGPFVESDSGMKHILVFTDHFTKWCEMIPTKNQLATTVAEIYIERIFCRFGCSEVLISDRAKNFLSEVVEQINKLLGVNHRLTSPYHPQTNGQVEVYNRSIATMISHVVSENHRDWDKFVSFCQAAHNSSRHTIINASPSSLLMCREMRMPFDLTKPEVSEEIEEGTYAEHLRNKMRTVWNLAREHIGKGKERQKKYYDKKSSESTLRVGDAVLYYNRRGYRHRTSKLIKRWTGIYIIVWTNDTNADIQLFDEPDSPTMRVHLNNLKLYRGPLVRGSSSDLSIDFESPSTDDDDDDDLAPVSHDEDDRHTDKYTDKHTDIHTDKHTDVDRSESTDCDGASFCRGSTPDRRTSTYLAKLPDEKIVRPPQSADLRKREPTVHNRHDDTGHSTVSTRRNGNYRLRPRPRRRRDSDYYYSKE